jgi:hypothetical protein
VFLTPVERRPTRLRHNVVVVTLPLLVRLQLLPPLQHDISALVIFSKHISIGKPVSWCWGLAATSNTCEQVDQEPMLGLLACWLSHRMAASHVAQQLEPLSFSISNLVVSSFKHVVTIEDQP